MKKTVTLILVNAIAAFTFAQSPYLEWAKSIGGIHSDFGNDIITDSNGNIYSTGGFYESIMFHGPESNNILNSNGEYDIYISKHTPDGELQWFLSIGGSLTEYSHAITLDAENNVYVCGDFQGAVDFNPGTGEDIMVSNGTSDAFITKYSSNGDYLWTKTFGGDYSESFQDLAVYDNKLYLGGYFEGPTVTFYSFPLNYQLVSSGGKDGLLVELTTDGQFTSAKKIGGVGNDEITSMYIDNTGNLFCAGSFSIVADLNPTSGTELHSSSGQTDSFVLKMTEMGEFAWVRTSGALFNDKASKVFGADNGIVVAGNFQLTVDFNPSMGVFNLASNGSYDCYVQKLDNDGNFIWAYSYGGTGVDIVKDLFLDSNGEMILTGSFEEEVDLNPGIEQYYVASNGLSDGYILKLDHNGGFIWAETMGNSAQDSYNAEYVDVNGNMHFTGLFNADVDFEPGVETYYMTSEGESDAFIQKLQICSSSVTTQQITSCGPYVWIDGNVYDQSTNTPTIVLTATHGCDSIIQLHLEVINVETGATLFGNTITADQVGADAYQWIDCNTGLPIDGETNQEFSPQSPGSYAAQITVGSCSDVTNCVELQLSGLENNFIDDEFIVYPNPTYGEFVIKCPENNIGQKLTIVDARGSLVHSENVSSAIMNLTLSLDAGIYLVKIDKLVERLIIK